MIFVDANIFVYGFGPPSQHAEAARQALQEAGEAATIATSYLVLDEFVWASRRVGGQRAATRVARQILDLPSLRLLPIRESETRAALDLMDEPGLTPHDAAHAATALGHGCQAILSTDEDFDQLDGLERIAP